MDLYAALDKWFSLFIRLRAADSNGMVHCYTCPERKHYKEMECGHFIKRGHEATRWDKNNCRPQCKECNGCKDGRADVFEDELREELGDDVVNKMIKTKYQLLEVREELWYVTKLAEFQDFVKRHPAYQKWVIHCFVFAKK